MTMADLLTPLFSPLAVTGLICLLTLVYIHVKDSVWKKVRTRFPGPPRYPLVGSSLEFWGKKNDALLGVLASFKDTYGWRYSIPFGPKWYVGLMDPEGTEKLLSSSTHLTKGDVYKLFGSWLGEGLLTSTDKKWQQRRKLLTPAFHFKILEDFMKVFNQKAKVFIQVLRTDFKPAETRNIFPYITRVALDVICETAMGVNIKAQTDQDTPYVRAVYSLCDLLAFRFVRPWYYPDFVWRWTQQGKRNATALKTVLEFTKSVIAKRKQERKIKATELKKQDKPKEEDENVFFGQKKRLAFLDMLLDSQENPQNMLSDEDIREEVDTFMFEGHDTTAASIGWTTFLLGCNQEHQDKVHAELENIFGDDKEREITSDDLSKMKYLEMCIKESLRLYPSVPFFARHLRVDFEIGDVVIPKGANIFSMPFFGHRNPEHFPDPEKFDPLRFTPENSVGRHPYAYVPFSAGPRNCIGQKFALMEEKVILANLFRNFKVQAACELKDVVVMIDVITRPRDGFPVKLIPL